MTQKEKILASYLPFGLKFMLTIDQDDFEGDDFYDHEKFKKGAIWELCGYAPGDLNIYLGEGTFDGFLFRNGDTYCNFHNGILPILHPLNNVLSEITENDSKFFPAEVIWSIDSSEIEEFKIYGTVPQYWKDSLKVKPRYYDYWVIQNLLKWHFDFNNLIEKGEAVDINTLNK